MSKYSTLIEQITSKEFVEADKLFEQLMAERITDGIHAKTSMINEEIMAANPDLFTSPVDQKAAVDHAPVEADHSVRTDEIEVPEPVEVDGHRDADPDEEEQEAMNEETLDIIDNYTQTVLESHDFGADADEQHQHPENVAKVPVGASADKNQGTVDMEPSEASAKQVDEEEEDDLAEAWDFEPVVESLDHSGVVCEDCGGEIMAEEEHVCEAAEEDSDSEELNEMFGGRGYNFQFDTSVRRDFEDAMLESGEVMYKFMDDNRNEHKVLFAMDETEADEVFNVSLHSSSKDVDHKDMMTTILNIMETFVEEHDAQAEADSPETQLRGLHVTLPEEGYRRFTGLLRRFASANGFRMGGARKHRRLRDNTEVMTIFLNRTSGLREELSPKQKKIDLNKNGKIDGSDLAKLRNEEEHEEGTDEPGKPEGDELEEGKGPDKAPRSRRSPYTVGDKAARVGGNVAGALAGYGAGAKAGEALGLGPVSSAVMGGATGVAAGTLAGTATRQANRKLRGAKE